LGFFAHDEYLVNLIMMEMSEDLNLKKVEYVPLSAEEVIRAFEDKKVDVLYVLDPYRAYMIYSGNLVIAEGLASTYVVPNIPYGAVVMRKEFVTTENKLAAIRVKNAVEAAMAYVSRNPDVAKRYVLRLNGLPEEGEIATNMRAPEFERLAEVGVKSVENMQTELVKRGIGTCGIKPAEFLFEKVNFAR
jgi:ABC-type nitrate/sulfonate/bicarbonate transport system substrate-binding protein